MFDSASIHTMAMQVYAISLFLVGYWFGQRGISGVIADLKGDVASLKAKVNVPTVPVLTPSV